MINVICTALSFSCLCLCVVCVCGCKNAESDRDYYRHKYLEMVGKLDDILDKWGKTITLCKKVNDNNGDIIMFNKRLIKELEVKEDELQTSKDL